MSGSPRLAPPGRPQAASLDDRTQLRKSCSERSPEWLLGVYEGTGEVTACFRGGSQGPPGTGDRSEEERKRDNLARTARRRASAIRRFCVKNQLTRLWTLTYGVPEFDRRQVLADVGAFFRRFYERFGKVPWLWVLEFHKGGFCEYCQVDHPDHRYHVHLALPAVFLDHRVMAELWGHGYVNYRDRRRKPGQRALSGRDLSRKLATYLAKYVAKDCAAGFAEHGYDVAESFGVRCRRVRHLRSINHVRRVLVALDLGELQLELHSDDWPDWHGPPVYVWWFDG